MKKILAMILAAALVLGLFAGCKKETDPAATGEGDKQVNVVSPVSMVCFDPNPVTGFTMEEPADLKTSGTSEKKTVSVLVGDNDGSYTTRTLKGFQSEMSFTISGVTPNKTAMLDIEEIHLRTDGAIAYSVFINGTEVYGRVYTPSADGPNHCYFDIPADVIGDSGTITVRIVNKADTEVRFRRIWAISDPEQTAKDQGIAKKMDVVIMLNEVPSNLNYTYLKDLVNSYKCNDMYNVGLCWEIQYMQWGKEQTEAYLENVINASLQTGAVLYLGINSWWSGSPIGVDGLGGSWADVPYQQVTWNPKDLNHRGQWQISSPNAFGDTPWLSMNNDHYNEARVQRIQETVEYLQLRTAELAVSGQELPAIHLYTENEPHYWPLNWIWHEYENYQNGVGDFSGHVISDAAADGVTLDPTDGLNEEEQLWLYRNLHTYISEVGQAMEDGAGYNYITIKDGTITYPDDQMVNNSYSHSPDQANYPNWDTNQKSWENHILDSIHFGGEWATWLDDDRSRSMDYMVAYGSFANINCERAGFPGGYGSTDFRVLSQCYAYGMEGVVIYNILADSDQQQVIEESLVGSTAMEQRYFDATPIFESDFTQKKDFAMNNTLVDIQKLRWDGTAVVPNNVNGGMLTYRIRNAADYDLGLRVSTKGSFSVYGNIEVLVGTSKDNMKSVGVYDSSNIDVQIDPSFYAGSNDVYIGIRLYSEGMTTTELAGLALSHVGIYRSSIPGGRTDGTVYTYDENRIRCQIIAARADVERMLEKFMEKAGELDTDLEKTLWQTAMNLYNQGRYGEAFTAISQGISQLLPAYFTVSGYGQLGQYPISVEMDARARLTICLKEVSDTSVRFTMSTTSDVNVTVSLLTDSGKWSMKQESSGDWVISAGDTAPADGKASFTVALEERTDTALPEEFEARLIHGNSGGLILQSQDLRVTDYSYSTTVNIASDAKFFRGPDGTAKEDLQPCEVGNLASGDYLQVKLDDRGMVKEVYAWYGTITGKVVKVEEMVLTGEMSNAFVTVEAADGTTKRLEIGWDTKLSFTGATGELGKVALVERVGLTVGQQITVQYCPYTVNDRTRAIEITD